MVTSFYQERRVNNMAYLRKIKKNDKVVGWQINVNYIDPKTGKRKRKTKVAKTKKEAEKVMANMITKYENGPMLNPDNLTLGDYLKDWLNDKKNEVEYRTYKEYYNICHTNIIPALGKLALKEIVKPYYIKKYLAEKRANGRIRCAGGLSERTLNYHYTTLNNALEQAVKFEIIPKNPCTAIKPPSAKKKTKEIVFLTFDEVKELLDFLDGNWLYPLTFLEVNSGLRRGEMAALQ